MSRNPSPSLRPASSDTRVDTAAKLLGVLLPGAAAAAETAAAAVAATLTALAADDGGDGDACTPAASWALSFARVSLGGGGGRVVEAAVLAMAAAAMASMSESSMLCEAERE
mmetsp:Transcript_65618/g.132045  ORF Transcript_65618/g.132045 Transcript_65618/m.132045 type:complete len:112 (-) Transcript_65618:243-578(-)